MPNFQSAPNFMKLGTIIFWTLNTMESSTLVKNYFWAQKRVSCLYWKLWAMGVHLVLLWSSWRLQSSPYMMVYWWSKLDVQGTFQFQVSKGVAICLPKPYAPWRKWSPTKEWVPDCKCRLCKINIADVGFTKSPSIYYFSLSVCLFVCPLPFFSTTTEPFALKLVRILWYDIRKTAKHNG